MQVSHSADRRLGYVVAFVGPILAVVVRPWVDAPSGGTIGFGVTWIAVILAAALGGFGPGIVATIVGGILGVLVPLSDGSTVFDDEVQRTRLALFMVDGLLLAAVAGAWHRGRRQAEEAQRETDVQRAAAEAATGRLAALQALTAELSRARTTLQVARTLLEGGRHALGAEACAVLLLSNDGASLELVDGAGYDIHDLDAWRQIPMEASTPATDVVRSGRAVFAAPASRYDRAFPHRAPSIGAAPRAAEAPGTSAGAGALAPGVPTAGALAPRALAAGGPAAGALAAVPLGIGGVAAGAVVWRWDEPRPFEAAEREAITAMAALTAGAMERTRLYEDERAARVASEQARARTQALQELAGGLARAASVDDVAKMLVYGGHGAIGARGGIVALLEAGGDALVVRARFGADAWTRADRFAIDDDTPLSEAVRRAEPVLVPGGPDETGHVVASTAGTVSAAALPLSVGSKVVGAIGWTFDRARPWSADARALLEAIARLGGQAIERAGLYESELETREAAESARRRTAVLAEAGRVLGVAVEYDTTIERIARLALPLLGDTCCVDVLKVETPRRIVATVEPAGAEMAAFLRDHGSGNVAGDPMLEVLRTGRTLRLDLEARLAEVAASDGDTMEGLHRLGARHVLVVALPTPDEILGTMLIATSDPARAYDDSDVATAEALAQRAARAVENVRLHRQVRALADREREHAQELESVIASIGEGIVVIGADGLVVSMNEAAERLLGGRVASATDLKERFEMQEAIGRPLEQPAPVSTEHRLRSEPRSWIELTSYPVGPHDDGSPSGLVCVLRDVTAFRQGQRLREAFLSLLSHELRTPVTTIYAGATVLGRRDRGLSDEVRQEVMADVAAEADRLYRLVEDLLVLARFDEGMALGEDPNLLQRIVPVVVEQERGRWPHVRFEVNAEPDLPSVRGDETAIQQVLRNLCSNSAKYSPPGSTVQVRVERSDGGVAVRVLDSGPGILVDEAEHLFDPFYRSPATATVAAGAGIGLYVCRRLMDAMGGVIGGRPRPGGGSEFTFSLPAYGLPDDEPEDEGYVTASPAEGAPTPA